MNFSMKKRKTKYFETQKHTSSRLKAFGFLSCELSIHTFYLFFVNWVAVFLFLGVVCMRKQALCDMMSNKTHQSKSELE